MEHWVRDHVIAIVDPHLCCFPLVTLLAGYVRLSFPSPIALLPFRHLSPRLTTSTPILATLAEFRSYVVEQ